MGNHEDDRIRAKNKIHNAAYELYTALNKEGTDDREIELQMKDLIQLDPTSPRNDIYSAVLKIVEGKHEKATNPNSGNSNK